MPMSACSASSTAMRRPAGAEHRVGLRGDESVELREGRGSGPWPLTVRAALPPHGGSRPTRPAGARRCARGARSDPDGVESEDVHAPSSGMRGGGEARCAQPHHDEFGGGTSGQRGERRPGAGEILPCGRSRTAPPVTREPLRRGSVTLQPPSMRKRSEHVIDPTSMTGRSAPGGWLASTGEAVQRITPYRTHHGMVGASPLEGDACGPPSTSTRSCSTRCRRAEARQRSIGEVLSEAARRGLREPYTGVRETQQNVPVFDVADDAPAIDEAAVAAALDEFP